MRRAFALEDIGIANLGRGVTAETREKIAAAQCGVPRKSAYTTPHSAETKARLSEIAKATGARKRASGFTLIELLTVVAIMAILAAILLPVLIGARNKARQAICASNLHQLGSAIQIYSDDHDGYLPIGAYIVTPLPQTPPVPPYQVSWRDELLMGRYVTHLGIFTCPSATLTDYHCAYGANAYVVPWSASLKLESIPFPSYTVLVTEKRGCDWPACRPTDQGLPNWQPLEARHNSASINVLYADGRVGHISVGEIDESSTVIWKP